MRHGLTTLRQGAAGSGMEVEITLPGSAAATYHAAPCATAPASLV